MSLIRDLRSVLNFTVIVAGLGYFVDLFDITLFGVVRVASLRDLGITDPADILSSGLIIYNSQMAGMMKIGRASCRERVSISVVNVSGQQRRVQGWDDG